MENHISPESIEQTGNDAKEFIYTGTEIIGNIASSILGPKGSLKLISHPNGNISISNDGATVLKNLLIDHPTSRMLIDASVNQDWEEGDGTTTVAIMAHALLKYARKYGNNTHPITIIKGLEKSLQKTLELVEKGSMNLNEESLEKLAYTTLNSKNLGKDVNKFAKLCVEAINRVSCECGSTNKEHSLNGQKDIDYFIISKELEYEKLQQKPAHKICKCNKEADLNLIKIIKLPGSVSKSFICPGLMLKNINVLNSKLHPKILAINSNLDFIKVKMTSTKVDVNTISAMSQIEEKEQERIENRVDQIVNYNKNTDGNKFDVLINRQIVYDLPMRLFENQDIQVIENVGFDSIEQISKITDTKVIGSFESCQEGFNFGCCHSIDTIRINSDRFSRILNCPNDCKDYIPHKSACTIVLFGPSDTVLDETERSVHDALCVISRVKCDKKVVFGGGATELNISRELKKYVNSGTSSDAIALKIFSEAILEIPKILCENSGGNSDEVLTKLKLMKERGYESIGVNINGKPYNPNSKGKDAEVDKYIGDMKQQNIFESARVKMRILSSATEIAQMLLKCDAFIKNSPRERERL
ncbi:T-complex protein 1 subunit beta [Cucumispora dikerogammari]|nr:T-complex protein 1 subunit beta [Cucumispora dikerogammari]